MGEKERKHRDVHVRWLVGNTATTGEIEPLVLAIPSAFNTELGREVWTDVSSQARSRPDTSESPIDRSAVVAHTLPYATPYFPQHAA